MPPNFPTSLDSLSNPTGSTNLNDPSVLLHSSQHLTLNDIVELLEAKLGIGSSTPGASAGVLRRTGTGSSGWGPILTGDHGPGSVANADIAVQAIRGGLDGAAGRIYPGTLVNGDLVAQTIRGGVDGATSRIVPGSLNYLDLAANAVSNMSWTSGWSGSGGPGYYPLGSGGVSFASLGGPVIVLFSASLTSTVISSIMSTRVEYDLGVAELDSPPVYSMYAASYYMTSVMLYMLSPAAGTHSYRPFGATNAGTGTVASGSSMLLLELKR